MVWNDNSSIWKFLYTWAPLELIVQTRLQILIVLHQLTHNDELLVIVGRITRIVASEDFLHCFSCLKDELHGAADGHCNHQKYVVRWLEKWLSRTPALPTMVFVTLHYWKGVILHQLQANAKHRIRLVGQGWGNEILTLSYDNPPCRMTGEDTLIMTVITPEMTGGSNS